MATISSRPQGGVDAHYRVMGLVRNSVIIPNQSPRNDRLCRAPRVLLVLRPEDGRIPFELIQHRWRIPDRIQHVSFESLPNEITDLEGLLDLGDKRKHKLFVAARTDQVARQIALVQTLHDNENRLRAA